MTARCLRHLCSLVISVLCCLPARAQQTASQPGQTNSAQAEMDAAVHQVEKIVNQPVVAYRRTAGMHVGVYGPGGWFHPGATKPDFNNVDVRTTQETPYASHQYVASDLNPSLVFLGSQLEFNSMTKYFYTNRSLPKKKLTEAEMLEINRLYRIIGRCEQQLGQTQNPDSGAASDVEHGGGESSATPAGRSRLLNPYLGGGALLVLGVILLVSFGRRGR